MPKRETEGLRAFRKEFARMTNDLRQWVDAPLILIGKATLFLLERQEVVTLETIRQMVLALDDPSDADLVSRTMKYLDQHSDTLA